MGRSRWLGSLLGRKGIAVGIEEIPKIGEFVIRLIFLDIDGVLNSHEWDDAVVCGQIHRDKVARLNRVLSETDSKIVLSSAWRYIVYRGESTMMGMEWLLRSHGILADRLIGVTREDSIVQPPNRKGDLSKWITPNERGQQITDYLKTISNCRKYVVIDDMDLGISECGHPFVKTDGSIGLTDADAELAIKLLS